MMVGVTISDTRVFASVLRHAHADVADRVIVTVEEQVAGEVGVLRGVV